MEITEVRIKLMDEGSDRLQAFCSITFDDCFVVRDLKIIEGASGPFVAMPSRKLTSHCPQCRCKNHLRAAHCNQCGVRLKDDRAIKDAEGRAKLYADIAHPINSSCREMIQDRVIEEFELEKDRAQLPDYVSRYDDFDVDIDTAPAQRTAQPRIQPAHQTHSPHARPAVPQTTDQPSSGQPSSGEATPAQSPPAPRVPPAPKSAGGPPSPKSAGSPKKQGFGAGVFE